MLSYWKSVLRSLTVFFFCLFLFSCGNSGGASFRLSSSEETYPLRALNSAARDGSLPDSGKTAYMYYAFPDAKNVAAALADESHPLSLKLSLSSDSSSDVTVAFLYDDDFDGRSLKHGTLSKRPVAVASVSSSRKTDLLLALPPGKADTVKGFLIQASGQITLTCAELCPARFALILEDGLLTAGFGPDGGSWKGTTVPDSFNFSQSVCYDGFSDGGYVTIHFRNNPADAGKNGQPGTVLFTAGEEQFSCRRTKEEHQVSVLYSGRFRNNGAIISVRNNKEMITGIEYSVIPKKSTSPIETDPGCIIDWPSSKWRNREFEFFVWDKFPSIFFFDTLDYDIQDQLFKRLAFFAEKEGWRGMLAPDSEIADQHGYNAHDYRAETLAAFFDKAEKENFPLNRLERELCILLTDNGVIRKTSDGYAAGEGAIISISQESARYLRSQLLSHETFHGLYFMTESFRNKVAEVRNTTDRKSLDFIYGYFESQPSLGYDPSDEYLMQNEFMAYILQLGVSNVSSYFAENLAWRGSVMNAMPELSAYIRETNAAGIVEAAQKLDDFVFDTWSMNAGRPWIVSMDYQAVTAPD